MAAYEIECPVEILPRIVLFEAHESLACIIRSDCVVNIVKKDVSQRVVHGPVEFISHKILSSLTVADLIGSVFPDFSDKQSIRISSLDRFARFRNERIRQLISNIEPPSGSAELHPVIDDASLSKDKLPVFRIVFIHFRQIDDTPPRAVAASLIFIKLVPAPVWRIFMIVCTLGIRITILFRIIGIIQIKIYAVSARMTEDSVKYQTDSARLCLLCQMSKILISSE